MVHLNEFSALATNTPDSEPWTHCIPRMRYHSEFAARGNISNIHGEMSLAVLYSLQGL